MDHRAPPTLYFVSLHISKERYGCYFIWMMDLCNFGPLSPALTLWYPHLLRVLLDFIRLISRDGDAEPSESQEEHWLRGFVFNSYIIAFPRIALSSVSCLTLNSDIWYLLFYLSYALHKLCACMSWITFKSGRFCNLYKCTLGK